MKLHGDKNELLYLNFNSSSTCLSTGSQSGFHIYDTEPTLSERFGRDFSDLMRPNGLGIVEILDQTNLIALVGGGEAPMHPTNKVYIWDDLQGRNIAELAFSTEVKAVRITREVVVVALLNKVYIYKFTDLSILHQFRIETFDNPTGTLEVLTVEGRTLIACLGEKSGEVRIFVYENEELSVNPIVFTAHENRISQLAISRDGGYIATSSEKGTLIRIFDVLDGKKIEEFRRGTQGATINSLAFNMTGDTICSSSDTGTIHIFSRTRENSKSSLSFLSGVVNYFGSQWSKIQFSIDEATSICTFGEEFDGKPTVIVICGSGRYYRYAYNTETSETEQVEFEKFIN